MGETKRRLMNVTNTAINELREHLTALTNAIGGLPPIPRFAGQADYNRRQEYVHQHVTPPTVVLLAQYTALRDAFDDIAGFLRSSGHSSGAKDELRTHRDVKRDEAATLGAQIRQLFQPIDHGHDGPIYELLTLLDEYQ